MNRLSSKERECILQLLCEGQSIRAVTRLTSASKNTVTKLLIDAGAACMTFHDTNVRNVKFRRVRIDETWSFAYSKRDNIVAVRAAAYGAEDIWTWTAFEDNTQLIVSYLIGGRDAQCAICLIDDLQSRLASPIRLVSDDRNTNLEVVDGTFGDDVDYSPLRKVYDAASKSTMGAECIVAEQHTIQGSHDSERVGMPYAYAECSNLTKQKQMRRHCLTNAFSKKIENHAYAVALHIMYYNFVQAHSKLGISPAMAAGVSKKIWEIGNIVKLVEAEEANINRKHGADKKEIS